MNHIDQMCIDLAVYFLGDSNGATPRDIEALSDELQQLCENFSDSIDFRWEEQENSRASQPETHEANAALLAAARAVINPPKVISAFNPARTAEDNLASLKAAIARIEAL